MWIVEDSGQKHPEWNMEADSKRLGSLDQDSLPCLRFYEWSFPSATYGYFLDPLDFFNPEAVKKEHLCLARRPTGGGVIFHIDDLAFSLVVPTSHPFYSLNSLHSYQMINALVLEAIQKVVPSKGVCLQEDLEAPRGGFCMAKPTKYDLLFEGKKAGGAAQRKTKKGLLHQSSLCLKVPDAHWLEYILKPGSRAVEDIRETSYALGVHLKDELKFQISQVFQGS